MTLIATRQVKGKGRGKLLGFPTVNCVIPSSLTISHGIYAVQVIVDGVRLQGAAHFGPVPTFDQKDPTLEIFFLDVHDEDLAGIEHKEFSVEFVARLRDVQFFSAQEDLIAQMTRDVAETRKILSTNP